MKQKNNETIPATIDSHSIDQQLEEEAEEMSASTNELPMPEMLKDKQLKRRLEESHIGIREDFVEE